MFESFDTSVSGMVSHRVWMDTISANMANIQTTRDEAGRAIPYRRKYPIFQAAPGGAGVQVTSVAADPGELLVRNPDHRDAIKSGPQKGYVRMPKIDWHTEMVNAVVASRAYEANLTALQVTKQMYLSDLRILA